MAENSSKKKIRVKRAPKAYDNKEFIHSRAGRELRILAEYNYPKQHFENNGIRQTIIFFGSARAPSRIMYDQKVNQIKTQIKEAEESKRAGLEKELEIIEFQKDIWSYYEDGVRLAELIAEWSQKLPKSKRFYICTGGGPGIMEAGNKGAHNVGAPSIGLNISLPFEQDPNQFMSPNLNFEFHYFFMRKFWFAYMAQALVVFPGGFGTMDELFELLTLKQTEKIKKPMPIILYNENYWKNLVNFEFLAKMGMISWEDLDLFKFANSPEEAFEYLKSELNINHNLLEES